jgi:hypothetical protein
MKINKICGKEREWAIFPTVLCWKTDYRKLMAKSQFGKLRNQVHYAVVFKWLNISTGFSIELNK